MWPLPKCILIDQIVLATTLAKFENFLSDQLM